jgi:hypothetical protein
MHIYAVLNIGFVNEACCVEGFASTFYAYIRCIEQLIGFVNWVCCVEGLANRFYAHLRSIEHRVCK